MPRRRHPNYRGGRGLLNLPGFQSTAAIVTEIEDTSHWPEGCDEDGKEFRPGGAAWVRHPNYTFQIANCDRSIEFDLNMGTPEGHENNLHKLDTMIRALRAFRKALAEEQQLYEQRLTQVGTWGER